MPQLSSTRAFRKYPLTTVSSMVSASFRRVTTLGSTGFTFRLRESVDRIRDGLGLHSLADDAAHGEDTGAAVASGAGTGADLGEAGGPRFDRGDDLLVADHGAVAHDHVSLRSHDVLEVRHTLLTPIRESHGAFRMAVPGAPHDVRSAAWQGWSEHERPSASRRGKRRERHPR